MNCSALKWFFWELIDEMETRTICPFGFNFSYTVEISTTLSFLLLNLFNKFLFCYRKSHKCNLDYK